MKLLSDSLKPFISADYRKFQKNLNTSYYRIITLCVSNFSGQPVYVLEKYKAFIIGQGTRIYNRN